MRRDDEDRATRGALEGEGESERVGQKNRREEEEREE